MPTRAPTSGAAPLATVVSDVRLPHRFRLERRHGGLRLSHRWLHVPVASFTLGLSVVWGVYLVDQLRGGATSPVFLAALAAPWLGTVYLTLSLLLNRTTIEIQTGVLSVRHGPLPWPRPADMPARDVKQLVVERHGGDSGDTFHVVAELSSGKAVTLVKRLDIDEQARTIERLLEEHLRIVDDGATRTFL